MSVSFHNPWALILAALLTAAVCFAAFKLKKKPDNKSFIKAANTSRIKANPLYKRRLIEAVIFRVLTAAGLILAIVAASFLIARPFKRDTVKDTVNRRDVFLCVDLSSSNYEGVQNLVQAFRDTVTGLDGDRIGISLFNTSSIQFVPMTDDYDFVLRRLDSLEGYLAAQEEFETSFAQKYDSVYDIPDSERARYEELNRILASFDEGLTAGYEMKGTSAIGEGLASCLFSFPELNEEERTRIIIFVTDNKPELLGNPLVTLTDAAGMCAFDKVTVFGIDPASPDSEGSISGTAEMQEAVESTGGKFYGPGTALSATEILADIQSLERKITKTTTATEDTDLPTVWFYVLAVGFVLIVLTTIYFVMRRGITKGKLSRKVTALIILACMAAGVIGVGLRPMYLSPDAESRTNNLDVAFVVDTTISMWAEDHKGGTRMDGVQKDIRLIMDALPGSSFSVISFSNGAEILTPFTQDIVSVSDIVSNLDMPSFTTSRGSSLNTAFEALRITAESAAAKKGNRKTIVFLFSDGETTDGSTLMSFSELHGLVDNGAVLGYGTAAGGRMNYPGRGYIKNMSDGTIALSHIDEDALNKVAGDLGLLYINETNDMGSALSTRLQMIRLMSRDAFFAEGNRTGYLETYHYFAGFVGLLLLVWLFLTIYRGGGA